MCVVCVRQYIKKVSGGPISKKGKETHTKNLEDTKDSSESPKSRNYKKTELNLSSFQMAGNKETGMKVQF